MNLFEQHVSTLDIKCRHLGIEQHRVYRDIPGMITACSTCGKMLRFRPLMTEEVEPEIIRLTKYIRVETPMHPGAGIWVLIGFALILSAFIGWLLGDGTMLILELIKVMK